MGDLIKTMLLVTLIAALIWIWAEGESFSSATVNPRVSFVKDSADLEISPDAEWRGTVRLRLEGSNVAIKQAEQLLGTALILKPGQPGVPLTPGDRQTVNLVEVVKLLPSVRQLGITVVDVDPPDVAVNVTKFVRREIAVRPELPLEIELLGEPTVTPQRVTVRMPEQLAAKLTETDLAVVTVSQRDLQLTRDDATQTLKLPITLPALLQGVRGVEAQQEVVSVAFRVRKNVDTVTLASVPVWVSIPPTETSSWDIEVKDMFLRDVVFTGPTDQIRRIRERTFVPIARVALTSDQLEAGITSKDADIDALPAGVTFSVASPAVGLNVKKRAEASPATPGAAGTGAEGGRLREGGPTPPEPDVVDPGPDEAGDEPR